MITEREKECREKLFRLLQEHPDLPIAPMVDAEIIAGTEYAWYLGSWGDCDVSKILCTDERIFFKDSDDVEEILSATKGWDWYLNATDEEVDAAFEALPWEEVISVYIGTL